MAPMGRCAMTTLKDIAAQAGVSIATVSYVLNGTRKVSDSTAKKVMDIARETGYQSNILAKSLRSRKTGMIGVIVEDIRAKHSPEIIDGINRAAEEQGYQILLSNLRLISKIGSEFSHISMYREDIEKALTTLSAMRADGIIYVGMHDRKIPHLVQAPDMPLVYCYCYAERDASFVCYDDKKTSYELARKFLDAGHRKFGILAGREDSEPCLRRLEGILKAMDEADIAPAMRQVIYADWKYETARNAVMEMLSQKEHPTAILALNDEMALGARDAAMRLHLGIPEDLSLSGFDNADEIQYVIPHITTVSRPLSRMGERAVELLAETIENETDETMGISLPCTIVEGESIRAV